VFEREMLSVPVMRRVLGDTLRGVGVNEDTVSDILLAATEACTNVVLHAGQSAPAYTVAATVDRRGCRVEVADAGSGCRTPRGVLRRARRAHTAAEGAPSEHEPPDHAALEESGRGFAIMSACVDEVTLRTAPGRGTRVVLDKRIAWDPPLARSEMALPPAR
jgi:serine/threonine-protein kinase RsbW